MKMPKFGTKNALFGNFGLRIKKTIVIFEISTLEFGIRRNFVNKLKYLNLGPKMTYLGSFGLQFENKIAIFEISTLEFV